MRHFFYQIRSKTQTNRDSFAHVFPLFASATPNYFEFWLVHWIICVLCDWLARASTLILVLGHLIETRSKLHNWYWFSPAMEVKHLLLFILFQRTITTQVFSDKEDPAYYRSAFFETKENKRLYGHVFKRFESPSLISCTRSCIETDWCSSTNFKVSPKDEHNGTLWTEWTLYCRWKYRVQWWRRSYVLNAYQGDLLEAIFSCLHQLKYVTTVSSCHFIANCTNAS